MIRKINKQIEKNRDKKRGFTLVETLVAVSILSISILGTFTAVQNGLQNSTFAKDQITAFYLTQEVMEYMRNIRDENALHSISAVSSGGSSISWLHGLSEIGSDPCYFGNTCTLDSPRKTLATCSGSWGSCPYLNEDSTSGLFGYTGGWPVSRFQREIQFQSINAHEIIINVSITWKSGSFVKTFKGGQSLMDWQ